MPRPPVKRRTSNKHNSTTRHHAPSNVGAGNAQRVKLQKLLATKAVGQRPLDSDDSDRLVTRTRRGRTNLNPGNAIFASGAVAEGDRPGSFPSKEERRQRLRSETNEIIRRSRSKSTEDVNGVHLDPVGTDTRNGIGDASAIRSPQRLTRKTDAALAEDKSVLGTLKPRKRQASILHLVDNSINNSSIIGPEDEEQFLPDDESTPLNTDKTRQSVTSIIPSTRKRKFGTHDAGVTSSTNVVSTLPALSSSPLSEPISLPSNPSRPRSEAVLDDEIMAPPQSSSPASSPQKSNPVAPVKSKTRSTVSKTVKPRSLMPSKRHKAAHRHDSTDTFDIPQDSSTSQSDGAEDTSIFQLRNKRSTKSRTRQNNDRGVTSKARPKSDKILSTKAKSKSKSTSTVVPSVSVPTTPRTPLALTSNSNQENRGPLSVAPSSKLNGGKNSVRNMISNQKQLGGSPLSHTTAVTTTTTSRNIRTQGRKLRSRGRLATGAENDQENRMAYTAEIDSESPPRPTSGRSLRTRATTTYVAKKSTDANFDPKNRSQVSEGDRDDMNVDHLVASPDSLNFYTALRSTPLGAEAKAWQDKWKGIDDFDLDFEDVSVTTPSMSENEVGNVDGKADGNRDDGTDASSIVDETAAASASASISVSLSNGADAVADRGSPLRRKSTRTRTRTRTRTMPTRS